MSKKRVMVFLLQDTDGTTANPLLENCIETEGYLLGDAKAEDIQTLRDQGLVIEELHPLDPVEDTKETSEKTSYLGNTPDWQWKNLDDLLITTSVGLGSEEKLFFKLQLKEPLVDERREELLAMGVELIAALEKDSFKIKLAKDLAEQVLALPFVASLVLYDQRLIKLQVPESGRTRSIDHREEIVILDIRLNEADSLSHLLAWLEEREVTVVENSAKKIRIELGEFSPLINEISQLQEVHAVESYIPPKFHNDRARVLIGLAEEVDGKLENIVDLNGEGQIIGVADSGIYEDHPDIKGRVIGTSAHERSGDASDIHGHGTHVVGSILGDGTASNGQIQGMAPKAKLFFQSIVDDRNKLAVPMDLNTLFQEAYDQGVRIHNNSWGIPTKASYTNNSHEVDEFMYANLDMLILISAGNEGTDENSVHTDPGYVDWLSVSSPATSKNALTVGASRSDRTSLGRSQLIYNSPALWGHRFRSAPIADEKVSGDPESIAAFSGRGPCDDERIKPDVVGPGTDIVSTKALNTPLENFWGSYPGFQKRYAIIGGTSMSTPIVSGMAALIRQYYLTERDHRPSAALLKATIINSTRRLTGVSALAENDKIPNYHQGFGGVQFSNAIPNKTQPTLKLEYSDEWQTDKLSFSGSGQKYRFSINVNEGTPLRFCLVWTDPPGRSLQNILNLFVENTERDNIYSNPDRPRALTATDQVNNVQIIRIDDPAPGRYKINIIARRILVKTGQPFAVVVTGDLQGNLRKL